MTIGLCARNLTYAREERRLFQKLSFELKPGQGLLIQGPNGSGKTSLLRLLAGLISPLEGEILWNNQALSEDRLSYHQALHFLGHLSGVKQKLTVRENLRYSQNLADQTLNAPLLDPALESAGLLSLQNQFALCLSAGQKRRLALARLLSCPKKLWILDEPFTNLDLSGQAWLKEQVELHLRNQGLVILASHQALSFSGTWTTLTLAQSPENEALHA